MLTSRAAAPATGHRIARITAGLVLALSLSATAIASASAASREARRGEPGHARQPGAPVLAVVSLSNQHITVYDAEGKALQSPVSTGATGYETPAGIFTVVQKKEEHFSNLYEDGKMPFMQRITWTGIALHAGALPGYPASHGCIRLPIAFADRLFGLTELGLRVIVVRDDIAPQDIAHPVLFTTDSRRRDAALAAAPPSRVGAPTLVESLTAKASAMAGEAEAAARRAKDAKQAVGRRAAEAAAAARAERASESAHARAEKTLADAERALAAAAAAPVPAPEKLAQAESAKAKAAERLAAAAGDLQRAREQAEARKEAATRAADEARSAEEAKDAAAEAAAVAARKAKPVSVFVSRKARRLYVRRANEPLYEGPVTIREADKPIGTFVFTAASAAPDGGNVRWNVVSMYQYSDAGEPLPSQPRRKGEARSAGPMPADVAAAKSALDRITIPKEVRDELIEAVLPGSSLIISDEAASIETGKDTDFVVVMSGEPQGALKIRQREPLNRFPSDGYYYGSRKPQGGFPFFWD